MSFNILGVSVFIEAFIFMVIPTAGLVYARQKRAYEWF